MQFISWFIALRYLVARERRVLISANAIISIAGVAVGVAVLVVTMGIMDGAWDLLSNQVTLSFPHVRIAGVGEHGEPGTVPDDLAATLARDPRVKSATPVLSDGGMLQAGSDFKGEKDMIGVLAVDRLGQGSLYDFQRELGRRSFQVEDHQVLIGSRIAERLGVKAGAQVTLYAIGDGRPRPMLLTVQDVFQTGGYEFDSQIAFVNPAEFRRIYRAGAGASYIHVTLRDPYIADAFAAGLALPGRYSVSTWMRDQAQVFVALRFEKYLLMMILMVIVVVAAFNIIGTLVLIVIDKTRQIGILKAIGMPPRLIARIFFIDGALIGAVGTLGGVVLGLLVSWGLRLYKFPMPASIYNFGALPIVNHASSVATVALCAILVCMMASALPAFQASRLNPVEALRYE